MCWIVGNVVGRETGGSIYELILPPAIVCVSRVRTISGVLPERWVLPLGESASSVFHRLVHQFEHIPSHLRIFRSLSRVPIQILADVPTIGGEDVVDGWKRDAGDS